MKHIPLFICLSLSISLFSQKPTYDATIICLRNASPQDAQLLLNLAYWSYQRSHATVMGQDIVIDHLKNSWMLWHNFISTRRNPQTTLTYPDCLSIDTMSANIAMHEHMYANTMYLHALETTVEKSIISSESVKSYIAALRSEARMLVAQTVATSLTDLKQTLQQMLTAIAAFTPFDKLRVRRENEEADTKLKTETPCEYPQSSSTNYPFPSHPELVEGCNAIQKNIFEENISFLINGFALQSFGKFDKEYLSSSAAYFEIFSQTQTLYNHFWQQVETTRSQFYQQAYMMIYESMTILQFPAESFFNAFNQNGLIANNQQYDKLPFPLS